MESCSRIPSPRDSDPTSWANRLQVFAAVLLVSTALPAVSAVPQGYGYQPVYEPSYPAPASYEPPAYNPPAYSPPPYTPPSYDPPAYAPTYDAPASYDPAPAYQSYDPPAYNPPAYAPPAYTPPAYNPPAYNPPAYNPPAYNPPAYTPTYYSKPTYYQQYDNYDAITFRELNASIHCGVIPATNDDLYKSSKDVAPFGKYPFVVQIVDDYNNFVCQGVVYQMRFVLTAKSCIYGSTDKYRVRVDDWDILTNYNEYEAYENSEFRICDSFPVSYDSASTSYVYGPPTSELLILEIDTSLTNIINDKKPAYRHICLPTYPYTPAYTPPSYTPPAYSPQPYAAAPYTPPAYAPPPSYPSYSTPTYSECWVVGWYGSDATQLKNHPPPTEVQEAKAQSYSPAPSYGYSPSYNPPAYSPAYEKPKYYNEYYQYYDQSKIERRAKVKEIKCPSYGGYGSPAPSGYGYGGYKDESVCFVGVEGYDACVADKGAAVFCLVPERKGYEGGYNNYDTSYESKYGYGSSPQTYYASYAPYDQSYDKPDITALTSPPKQDRQRAVLYAIVQKPTSCTPPQPSYGGYGSNNYQQQQSKPITATKVTSQVVDAIEDNFFQNVLDLSCPAPKTYYPEPQVQYAPAYAPPAYTPPAYSPPAYVPPAYSPPPTYNPPAYNPPAYNPPAYNPPAYNPPAYNPPAYNPPAYSPPPYTPPSYNPPAYAAY